MPDMTLAELAVHIDQFPEAVTAALKDTAHSHATRIATRAAEILRAKTHGTGKTAKAIRVIDQTDRRQWLVSSPGDESDPANLPMWLEFGTRYMTARAYLRPAADEDSAAYVRDMTHAAEAVARALLE